MRSGARVQIPPSPEMLIGGTAKRWDPVCTTSTLSPKATQMCESHLILENRIVQPNPNNSRLKFYSETKIIASVSKLKHFFREFDPGSG